MDNLFDRLQKGLIDTCTTTFGLPAIWHNLNGSMLSAKVLFRDPSQKVKVNEVEYLPPSYHMEYGNMVFPGLKENVDNGLIETVDVGGSMFHVAQVYTKYDGKTFIAVLTPIP